MGRFIDLCTDVATEAGEDAEGLVLPPDAWDRFRQDFGDDEIEDALKIVQENYLQDELVDAADSLSTSLVEVLGAHGGETAFAKAQKAGVILSLDVIDHLARRLSRLEDILTGYREGAPPDRRGLDALMGRLLDRGIELDMKPDTEKS